MTHKEIFLVPYAHLDTQWRWEYPTTIKKYIKATIEENLYLFDNYPEHRFNFTGAIRYQMMKEYYPDQFQTIKQLIKEGRWMISGTCLDETDALVPSIESMIRNILYGDRWARQEFGQSSRDYMIPDCFGFPANMPSVLTHCGINGFSSQKLTWNSAVGIPFEIGKWRGPDNAELVCALNPKAYVSRLFRKVQNNKKRLQHLKRMGSTTGVWKSFQYYGVGDIGGAPKETSVKNAIKSIKASNDELVVRQGAADQFFHEITDAEKEKMDDYAGDLLLINHSAGTLTSATIMKRWNRKNEQMAFAAEVAALSAQYLAGMLYPSEKIQQAWYRIIGNQMHDILPGTSTPTAYTYSQNDEVIALNTWTSILHDSAQSIAPYVQGEGNLLIFNPLGETRKDVVEVLLDDSLKTDSSEIVLHDASGTILTGQICKNSNGQTYILFTPELLPFSWQRFQMVFDASPSTQSAVQLHKRENDYILENMNYRVIISRSGSITSIYHKNLKKELLKKPLAYEFQKERPKTYPSWNMDWKDRKKPPFHRIESGDTVSIVEQGPIRCKLRITKHYNQSLLIREIALSQDSETVDFIERIKWRELGCSFKLALTANMKEPEITYNWESSRIKRGLNNPHLFEMPSRLWVDMSEQDWGISILEDSKYGYDHPSADTLRMTLIYTPGIRLFSGFRDQKYHGWGSHTIRYALYAHKGDFKTTDSQARRFNQPPRSFRILKDTTSKVKKPMGLFDLSSEQIGISAIKQPEEGSGMIIRLYERYGKGATATLNISIPTLRIEHVTEINGLEESLREIPNEESSFQVQVPANGIQSYLIRFQHENEFEKPDQNNLKLPYNCRLIGTNQEKVGFYPAEWTPSEISSGDLIFKIAKEKGNNALQCNGQKILLPSEDNNLSLLFAAKKDSKAQFKWRDSDHKVIRTDVIPVSSMSNFIGQWDTRIWKRKPKHHLKYKRDYIWLNKCIGVKPGYINRARLEWYSSHTHQDGEDQPYHYGYMFSNSLDIPDNAHELILPEDNNVYIFAITTSQQDVRVKSCQYLQDKFDF